MTDFATRRKFMVDTQVRPSDVTKYPIIDAMLSVPREVFVPAAQTEAAYVGDNVPLAPGRVLLEARTFAKMLDALVLGRDDLVLDIGCGIGYSSAVMARMVAAVVAVEEDASLMDEARSALSDTGANNVILEHGPLAQGAPAHGPYDAIVIEGAVAHVPAALEDQLKEGGRMVAVFMEGTLGVVRLGTKSGGRLYWRYIFNASAPVLSGFAARRDFVFG